MNSYCKSTQLKNWIKTEEEITKIEKSKIEKVFNRICEVNALIKKENEEKSLANNLNININKNPPNNMKEIYNNENNNKEEFKKTINPKKYISLEKEKILIIVYANRLMKILKSKSSSLKNISISYFRRFFLKKSILDYDPFFLMAASLLLGSKVAQIKVPFEDIEASFPIIKNSIEKLFSYEFYLATILDYNFYVYNPYHSLLGLIYNLEKNKFFLAQNAENYINPEEFKQGCVDLIDKMYLTDNIFLFSYSEIALASIFLKCYEKNININKVSEKMEIDKIVNIKEFLEGPLEKMKKNLESIPEFENMEEANKRANEIYKVTLYFHKSFPQYQKKLDEERFLLKKKIKDFSDDFDELLDKKGLKDKKK